MKVERKIMWSKTKNRFKFNKLIIYIYLICFSLLYYKDIRDVYWITTFHDFYGIIKFIKIIMYWITTFKDYKSYGIFD